MKNIKKTDDLSILLKESIKKINEKFPNLSNLQIAKRLKIPNSTFDRLSKGEVQSPKVDYVIAIFFEIYDQVDVLCKISSFYPNTYDAIFSFMGFNTRKH